MIVIFCGMFPIGLLQESRYKCGMMLIMIIFFKEWYEGNKKTRLKKPQQKKNFCLLLGINQGGGIGVFLNMKSKR